jgi:hypothetical protein
VLQLAILTHGRTIFGLARPSLSIGLCAEGAGGRENQEGDFHNRTKWFKMSRAIKPPFHAQDFCVKIQLDASAPSFVHGVG